jgi:hypothetical protein
LYNTPGENPILTAAACAPPATAKPAAKARNADLIFCMSVPEVCCDVSAELSQVSLQPRKPRATLGHGHKFFEYQQLRLEPKARQGTDVDGCKEMRHIDTKVAGGP